MATPANTTIQRRYTAGQFAGQLASQCALEITSQPLALSKWYPQPVVQDLQFQLWIQDDASAEPVLLAQGDRAALQSISQYVAQQVQASLAIAHLSPSPQDVSDSKAEESASIAHSPQPLPKPVALQAAGPLSYLQLCDLASVIAQCDQAICTLPVAIPTAAPIASTPNFPEEESSKEKRNQEKSNVVPLSAAQQHPARRISARQSSQRRRSKIWASSAAVALFTVGLVSALRPNAQRDQQITASSPKPTEPQIETERPTPEAAESDVVPESESDVPIAAIPKLPRSQPSDSSTNDADSAAVWPSPQTQSPLPDSLPAPESPEEDIFQRPAQDNQIAVVPAPLPSTDSVDEAIETLPNDVAPLPPDSDLAETDSAEANQTERSLNEANQSGSNLSPSLSEAPAAEAPGAFTPDDLEVAASEPSRIESSADVAPPSAASRASTLSRDDLARIAEPESMGAVASQRADQQADAVLIQAKSYFQAQWQANGERIATPLSYELRLSETGEVVSFIALDETAQLYRDRLIRDDLPLQLTGNGSERQLRLEILLDGQVSVSEN